MQNLNPLLRRIRVPEKAVPIVFLSVLFLAFGLLIPWLGIYWDDWLFVYNAYARGAQGLWDFMYADGTPFSSFTSVALFSILGFKPLAWHLASLLARWLTVVAFWLVLRRLWPSNNIQTSLVALLFAIYPFFLLQPLAFTFLHVWVGYCFLGLSIYWMILSVQQPKKFWLSFILSLGAEIITILTLEYFLGLEFLRPLILWLILRDQEKNIRSRLIRVIKLWLPYLVVVGIYVWWRFLVYEVPMEHRNNPVGIKAIFLNPLIELRVLLTNLIPDVLSVVMTAWYKIFDPAFFNLADRRNLLLFALSLFAGLAIFLLFNHQDQQKSETEETKSLWAREAFWFGLTTVVLGLAPSYVIGVFINHKNNLWYSRLGLASILGASLLIVALLELISSKTRARLVIVALLVGLSVGFHVRHTNEFRWTWSKEQNFFRQLALRVPGLEPGTALIMEKDISPYTPGDSSLGYAIDAIYAQPLKEEGEYVNYWVFTKTPDFEEKIDRFINGMDMKVNNRSVNFIGKSSQSLVISFEPEQGQCLYVIRPQDVSFRKLSPYLKKLGHLSELEQIDTSVDSPGPFLQEMGLKYPDDWCTYYQKADLARQNEDYEKVIQLWRDANEKGLSPGAYFEYFLFLDGFTQLQRWDEAVELTFKALRSFPESRLSMCDYWNALPVGAEKDLAYKKVQAKLDCSTD
jgi:hypothetical protein